MTDTDRLRETLFVFTCILVTVAIVVPIVTLHGPLEPNEASNGTDTETTTQTTTQSHTDTTETHHTTTQTQEDPDHDGSVREDNNADQDSTINPHKRTAGPCVPVTLGPNKTTTLMACP